MQVETYDAFGDMIRPGNELAKIIESHVPLWANPVTGPIYIEGVRRGDVLVIEILDILVGQTGVTTVIPGFGALEGWFTKSPPITKFTTINKDRVCYQTSSGKRIFVPLKPFIGVLGVAPPFEAISTLSPVPKYGGNMDVPEVCPGNKVYLPVGVDGALLSVGDVHAAQGDGEICGTAVEVPATVTLKFNVLRSKTIDWPRIESEEEIITVGSGKPLEEAAKLAFRELLQWLADDYAFSVYDAYILLSIAARARIAQFVSPLFSVVARLPKEYLQ